MKNIQRKWLVYRQDTGEVLYAVTTPRKAAKLATSASKTPPDAAVAKCDFSIQDATLRYSQNNPYLVKWGFVYNPDGDNIAEILPVS